MTPAIRPYRPQDRAACRAVFRQAVLDGAKDVYSDAQRRAWAGPETTWDTADKLLDQLCWVAEADGDILGFMSLTKEGYLDMAFVRPEQMGKGVAGLLYDTLLTAARAEGFDHLTVHASHLARRFFAKQGWQVDYAEDYSHGGETFERFHMSLSLRENT